MTEFLSKLMIIQTMYSNYGIRFAVLVWALWEQADRPKQPSQAHHMWDTAQLQSNSPDMMLSRVNTHPREHHILFCKILNQSPDPIFTMNKIW